MRQIPRLKPWIKCETVLLNLGDWEGTETVTSYELRKGNASALRQGRGWEIKHEKYQSFCR